MFHTPIYQFNRQVDNQAQILLGTPLLVLVAVEVEEHMINLVTLVVLVVVLVEPTPLVDKLVVMVILHQYHHHKVMVEVMVVDLVIAMPVVAVAPLKLVALMVLMMVEMVLNFQQHSGLLLSNQQIQLIHNQL